VRTIHRGELHQITEYTQAERYPELFDLAAKHRPEARHILSFGCSSGEEIEAIRTRFPRASIVGAEINPRTRAKARRRLSKDANVRILYSIEGEGPFDIIFAHAVLQFQPDRIERQCVADLSRVYPFERFDRELSRLCGALVGGGLLSIIHAHYRVEDSSCSARLTAVPGSPLREDRLFDRNSCLMEPPVPAGSMFIKREADPPPAYPA
jgi:hypothetical protein